MAEAAGIGLFGYLMIGVFAVLAIWAVTKGYCRMVVTPPPPIAVVMPTATPVTVQVQHASWLFGSYSTVAASFAFAAGSGAGARPVPASVPAPTTPPFGPTTFNLNGAVAGQTAIKISATSAECGTMNQTITVNVS